MSYVVLIRKLSRACGSFQISAQLIGWFATPSQVVHHPCCPCAKELTLSSSCSILVTSATTRSFLSFLLALDHRMGGSLHPRPARPVWTMPKICLCCSLPITFCTSSLALHFLPVSTLEFTSATALSEESLNSITSLAFSCL